MFNNKTILSHTLLSLFLSQIIFWLVYFNFATIPPQIPLWFLEESFIYQIVDKVYIWLLPGAAIGILAVNLIVLSYMYRKHPFLVGIVALNTTLANLFLTLAATHIIGILVGFI